MQNYQLTAEAELDLESIAEYTFKKHGEAQMYSYIAQLEMDAEGLALGKGHFKQMEELHPRVRIAKSGKHYIFGWMQENAPMIVIAILHERMNLVQRLQNRLT